MTEIARRAPAVSSFPIVIALDETRPNLRSGLAVDVEIERSLPEDMQGISVPLSALLTQRPANLSGAGPREAEVFVFQSDADTTDTITPRTVKIGAALEDRVLLTAGLAPHDRIVTAGVPFLHPGQVVRLEATASTLIAEVSQ